MKLYEYTEKYRHALVALNEMDLSEDVITDTLKGLQGDIEEKGKNIAMYIRNIEADIVAIKSAEKMMVTRRQRMEARITWMKNYLLNNMQASNITEISCPFFTIKPKKNPPSVLITDDTKIPDRYVTKEEMIHIDKQAIKDDLKKGIAVSGASLTQGLRLDIR